MLGSLFFVYIPRFFLKIQTTKRQSKDNQKTIKDYTGGLF